jgi:ubiquinone biosynthesis protein
MAENSSAAQRFKDILKVLARYKLPRGLTPVKLRQILEDLGPTFVKFGQIMSMRPDMIPADYCEELSKLRADVKPMDFAEVARVLGEEYGEPPEHFFAFVDKIPFGSASIAQAHKASLKDGRSVGIKVQRPGIYEKMAQDAVHPAQSTMGHQRPDVIAELYPHSGGLPCLSLRN